jgi:hypothetical protein
MNALVVGVLALASALVREREDAVRGWTGRAQESQSQSIASPQVTEGDVVAGAQGPSADEVGTDSATGVVTPEDAASGAPTESSTEPSDASSDARWPRGQWQIACEIKSGSALVFDRASLREYGTVTLFRWSAPRTRVAGPGEQIFTALVNCREKTIEAAWPGRRRETYAGTCGRGLVEAVCAASEQAANSGQMSGEASAKARASEHAGASHAGAGVAPRR